MVCVNGKRLLKVISLYVAIHLNRWEEDGYTAHIAEKNWIRKELITYTIITKIIRGKNETFRRYY